MARRFRVPVGLAPLAADPAAGTAGDMYFNTSTLKVRFHDGSGWVDAGGSTTKAFPFFAS